MKKLLFAALAAFVMSLGFVSCSSSPEDKIVSTMESMVSLMKDTHIKSMDDVKALKEKGESLKKEVENAIEALTKDKSPEELMKLAESMKDLEKKMEDLSTTADAEIDRLTKEAEAAGIDASELDFLK